MDDRKLVISALHIYPIKGCKGLNPSTVTLGAKGPRFDRRWMLVDRDNRFVSQRQYPKMALIATELLADKLVVKKVGMPPLIIPFNKQGEERNVLIWKDTVSAIDQGNSAAEWFSEALGTPIRLVFLPDKSTRPIDPKYATKPQDEVSLTDGYPILIISEASLGDLNFRLPSPVPMNRFRPTLVISGCEPYEEDTWKKLRIGSVELACVKLCTRCIVTTIDQATGEKGEEPLKTLATYRKGEKGINFGQNAIHLTWGSLSVGQEVEVLA